MDDQHFALMASLIASNDVVPFLGAGVNLCGRRTGPFDEGHSLPNGDELASVLATQFRFSIDHVHQNLATVSQNTVVLVGDGPLYNRLRQVFDHDYEPTAVHRFLASLPAHMRRTGSRGYQLILTANYDDALERAFAEAGEPVDVLVYMEKGKSVGRFIHYAPDGSEAVVNRPNAYEVNLDERPCIVKIHGAIDRSGRQHDSFVITEDDYIDYVIRAGGDLNKVFPVDVLSKARNSHFLFLGYSLRDWNLRVVLNRIDAERTGTFLSWSIQLGMTDLEQRAWKARGVDVINLDLEDYVTHLTGALAADGDSVPA